MAGGLRKALGQHWIDRARAIVEHGLTPGKKPARNMHPRIARVLARHGKKTARPPVSQPRN